MDLVTRERDRLLQHSARLYGLCTVGLALLCLVVPAALDVRSIVFSLVPCAAMLLAYALMGRSASPAWPLVAIIAGLAAIWLLADAAHGDAEIACLTAIGVLAGFGVPAAALVLTSTVPRVVLLVLGFLATAVLTIWLTANETNPVTMTVTILLGWIMPVFIAVWLTGSIPKLVDRINTIGRAHRAERQASEMEAQRRQSARLLHDTVLATLTLLAHSGVGVSAEAMREQAAGDAQLLRQLRLGSTPMPSSSGGYNLTPVEETELGTTLESVKSRFSRMGLEVTWHGSGQLLMPSHILDAFLLALAECLENVRRHSGVTQAHVTITEDEETVRAMVTDQGVGFDLADVGEAKLGFAESVVARLRDVGGNARLFSAPGAGTTVVLEVPR